MQQKTRRMRTTPSITRWFSSRVCGIGLIALGIWSIYLPTPSNSNPLPSQDSIFSNDIKPNESVLQPNKADPLVAINTDSASTQTVPIGSVAEACGLYELFPYWDWDRYGHTSSIKVDPLTPLLESENCRAALETHVRAINPYRWGQTFVDLQFEFIVLDNPLTFERIFADPSGDFARVQDAMSRTECLLENGTTINFELKESCNADALMNYAVLNQWCSYGMVNAQRQQNDWEDRSPEQSRLNWQHALEGHWLTMKCQEVDAEQKLSVHKYPDLVKLLSSLETRGTFSLNLLRTQRSVQPEGTYPETIPTTNLITNLIEMAARLGDEAAGLTHRGLGEEGMRFGRFSSLFYNTTWMHLSPKSEPSKERFLKTFRSLSEFAKLGATLNWDWLVRRLCEPPFDQSRITTSPRNSEERREPTKPKSCWAVINELYIDGGLTDSELDLIDQFERTALKLNLYY